MVKVADVDKDAKTEEASPKRVRDSRKKGQIAKSNDLNAAISFLVFTMALLTLSQYLFSNGLAYMKNALRSSHTVNVNMENLNSLFTNGVAHYFRLVLPFALIAVVVGIISNLIQTGFLFTGETIKPDFSRINPIKGFKNIFSQKAFVTFIKNFLKLILVFYLTFKNLNESGKQILNSGDIGTEKIFMFIMSFIRELSMSIGIIMLILALADYVFQKFDHKKSLRMSKQEIKDEYKEMEGNPQIKAARQQRQRQLAMGRMMDDISTATVVVTNPTHIAVAIRYHSDKDSAPLLVAKGADYIALKIKDKAKEGKIPIIENKPLARAMYKRVEIGDFIPMDLYKAVAEILAIVYQMQKKNKYKI